MLLKALHSSAVLQWSFRFFYPVKKNTRLNTLDRNTEEKEKHNTMHHGNVFQNSQNKFTSSHDVDMHVCKLGRLRNVLSEYPDSSKIIGTIRKDVFKKSLVLNLNENMRKIKPDKRTQVYFSLPTC